MSETNGNGGGGSSNRTWQVVTTAAVTIGLGVLAAFWALSDPRAEIKTIRDTYLTIREFIEFRDTVTKAIARNESDSSTKLDRAEFERWKQERDKTLDHMRAELDEMRKQMVTKDVTVLHDNADRQQMDNVQRRIDQLYNLVRDLQRAIHEHQLSYPPRANGGGQQKPDQR